MRYRKMTNTLPLTAATLAKLTEPAQSQMGVWKKTREPHELLAVGEETKRDFESTRKTVHDMEKKFMGLKSYLNSPFAVRGEGKKVWE